MTLIAGIAFPDVAYIVSDSRATFLNNSKAPQDKLKKIYQLSHHLCISYTSEDVSFTHKIIEEITKESCKYHSLDTGAFLKRIIKVTQKTYQKLTEKYKSKPDMIFLFVGMDKKPLLEKRNKIKNALAQAKDQNYIPEKLKNAKISSINKYAKIEGPTPIFIKQKFPEGKISSTRGWDMTACGSGQGLADVLQKYYKKLFYFPGTFNKGVILSNLCEDYIKESKIKTIGGTIQIFAIDDNGVHPISYVEASGSNVKSKKYVSENGEWIEEKDGVVKKIEQNPFD